MPEANLISYIPFEIADNLNMRMYKSSTNLVVEIMQGDEMLVLFFKNKEQFFEQFMFKLKTIGEE